MNKKAITSVHMSYLLINKLTLCYIYVIIYNMIVKTFVEPPIDNNNYVLIDEITGFAALVDCSSPDIWDKVPRTKGTVSASIAGENREEFQNVTLKYILLTHGHFDHIGGLRPDILSEPNTEKIPVLMHKNDTDLVKEVNNYMPMMGMPKITVPQIDKFVEDNEIIQLGNTTIKVIHTPGHTQGGVCYYADNKLFSGDTIFRESVGRCDLPGGDFDQIVKSIKEKIFTLPNETIIYPGHGKPTEVLWEKEHNPYF